MSAAIEICGLVKSFGSVKAVDHLDLRVDRGELYGFLGRNGAGKTTSIRMLLGMIGPDQGTVTVLGQRVGRDRGPWHRVGSLVESASAWPNLTVVQNLRTLADLHGESAPAIDEVMDFLELTPLADRKARALSLGNLQRLGLALALLPHPELLVLDEPINGLDPAGVVQVRELLIRLARENGTTIFVSSHLLDEVSRTATKIGILHEGRLIKELDRTELDQRLSRRLTMTTPNPAAATRALAKAGLPVTAMAETGDLDLGSIPAELVAPVLVAAGVPLTRLSVQSEDLEDYFLRITGGQR